MQFSSTTASPGSSENRVPHLSSEMSSSGSKESTIRETVASHLQPPARVQKVPESELKQQLSTITEVDSRLQLTDPPDVMEELLRRNIIPKPFDWSLGTSLSELEDKGI